MDVEQVARQAEQFPHVVHSVVHSYMCSDPGQNGILDAIAEKGLDRVVVASCSPHMQGPTFMRAIQRAGLNPYLFEMANLREHCAWVHEDRAAATEQAIDAVRIAVAKARQNAALEMINIPVTKRALVIGGGVAGIQAALDIAAGGQEVVVVEREPSIGGHMAQLGETFPTLDCSQCILTPKMVELAQNERITLLTHSEVEKVDGFVGNFRATIRRKSTYVDWDKCNGCNECTAVCPIQVPNEFDMGMSDRTAIYRPFPQAVPSRFTISKRGISPCKATCPAETSAQGYIALIAEGRYEEALDVVMQYNPFPATVGRVCTHPCEGECNRGEIDRPVAICALKRFVADRVYAQREEQSVKTAQAGGNGNGNGAGAGKGKRVAIAGSGPAGLTAAHFLARSGYRVTVYEALPVPGGMMRVGIPAYRLPRDVLEREIGNILALGVDLRLYHPISDINELFEQGYEAVFLAIGAHEPQRLNIPGEDAAGVFHGVPFLRQVNLGERVELGKRVLVVGGGNTAIDAARSALRIGADRVTMLYRRSRAEMPANEWEIEEAEDEGVELELLTQPVEVLSENGSLTGVRCVRMRLGEPDASGRRRPIPVPDSDFVIEADALIAAVAQAPESSFLKPDHGLKITPWGTFEIEERTLETNRPGVFAGGDAARGPGALIEAIADGRRAALSIDRYLRDEPLLNARDLNPLPIAHPTQEEIDAVIARGVVNVGARERAATAPAKERIRDFREVELGLSEEQAHAEALRCLRCGICSECYQCEKACAPGAIDHMMQDEVIEIPVGSIVMATGYDLYDKSRLAEYGYGKYEDVISGLEFERILSASGPTGGEIRRPSDGKVPEDVVFIHCVGSRDPAHGMPYCSKICCMYSAKHAMLYKHRVHHGRAYSFYMDIRSGGKGYDEFVRRAIEEEGVQYLRGRVSRLFKKDGKIIVRGADTLAGTSVEIAADLVVLATAVVPRADAAELATKIGFSSNEHGFFNEAHPKLRPIETYTAGVYLAGACQSPRDIPDTVAQGTAAAAKVLQMFSDDKLQREPLVASVDPSVCNGCFFCRMVCPYDAIQETELVRRVGRDKAVKVIAEVNEGKCMGCGLCASACPSKAVTVLGFTDEQVYEEVMHAI